MPFGTNFKKFRAYKKLLMGTYRRFQPIKVFLGGGKKLVRGKNINFPGKNICLKIIFKKIE